MFCGIGFILQRKKWFDIYKISHELNKKLKSHGCLNISRKFPLTKFYFPYDKISEKYKNRRLQRYM